MEEKVKARLQYLNKAFSDQYSKVETAKSTLKEDELALARLEGEIGTLKAVLSEIEEEKKQQEKEKEKPTPKLAPKEKQ